MGPKSKSKKPQFITEYEVYSKRYGYRYTTIDSEEAYEEADQMDDGFVIQVRNGKRSKPM